jgi:hypothetical protein
MRAMRALLVLAATTAAAPLAAAPMSFRTGYSGGNCEGCEYIVAEGEITAETPQRFQTFFKDNALGHLMLHSPGGDLQAGLQLGEFIRQNRLKTRVARSLPKPGTHEETIQDGVCASACVFAFLGGVVRVAGDRTIGVHQFYLEAALRDPTSRVFSGLDLSRQQLLSAVVVDYVYRMGADTRLIARASSVLPTSMKYLTLDELKELRVVWDADEWQPWKIEQWAGGLVSSSRTNDERASVVMFCRADQVPRALISLSEQYLGAAELKRELDGLPAITAFGVAVGRQARATKVAGPKVSVELKLPGFTVAQHTGRDGVLVIDDGQPRAGTLLKLRPTAANFAGATRLALRNCL